MLMEEVPGEATVQYMSPGWVLLALELEVVKY